MNEFNFEEYWIDASSDCKAIINYISQNVSNAAKNNIGKNGSVYTWGGEEFLSFIEPSGKKHKNRFKEQIEKLTGNQYRTLSEVSKSGTGIENARLSFCLAAYNFQSLHDTTLEFFIAGFVRFTENHPSNLTFDEVEENLQNVKNKIAQDHEQSQNLSLPMLEDFLKTPQEREGNHNYFANEKLKIVGREDTQNRLKKFLEHGDKNLLWFQLAGEGGQGKSRLALDLVKFAKKKNWHAGFVDDEVIVFFENHLETWSPKQDTLLVFDYVVGYESELKNILRGLSRKQSVLQKKIRILILERQAWNATESLQVLKSNASSSNMMSTCAYWYSQLCDRKSYDGKDQIIESIRFDLQGFKGVEELFSLGDKHLVAIVKSILKENKSEFSLDDEVIADMLKRIDSSGRPLFAHLLGSQLSNSIDGYESWTKIDLLTQILNRDMDTRWAYQFQNETPTWGEKNQAVMIAIAATIVGKLDFDDKIVEQCLGATNQKTRRQVLTINNNLVAQTKIKYKTSYGLEPDLLGEWFVLLSFCNGLDFEDLLNFCWTYEPRKTAHFLVKISQDFLKLPANVLKPNITLELLNHRVKTDEAVTALAMIVNFITYKLIQSKLKVPDQILVVLSMIADSKEIPANGIESITLLAHMHEKGIDTKRNESLAFSLYEKCAKYDHAPAYICMANLYRAGTGVEQSWKKAVALYEKALSSNITKDAAALLSLAFHQRDDGLRNDKKAVEYCRLSIASGNIFANSLMGLYYENGFGVEKSTEKAIEYFNLAADSGDADAFFALGQIYFIYKYGEDFAEQYFSYNKKAFELGHIDAAYLLGCCYYNADGTNRNLLATLKCWGFASDNGHADASFDLAALYYNGTEIEKDRTVAHRYFQRAYMAGHLKAKEILDTKYW